MNYFEMMAYTNIGLCILIVILIILEIIKIFSLSNVNRNIDTNLMSNYEIERQLKEINRKLEK